MQYIPLKGNECAKMALFDDAVGRLVEALRETGQLRDTLIVCESRRSITDKQTKIFPSFLPASFLSSHFAAIRVNISLLFADPY